MEYVCCPYNDLAIYDCKDSHDCLHDNGHDPKGSDS